MDEKTKLKRMINELVDTQSENIDVEFQVCADGRLLVTLIYKPTKHSVFKVLDNYDSFYSDLEQMKSDLLYFCTVK